MRNANKPAIRFKGFGESWKEDKIENIATFMRGNSLSKSDISESSGQPCILYGHLYTEYGMIINDVNFLTNSNRKNLIYSQYGDVLLPSSDTTPTGLARASSVNKDGVALGGDINILRPSRQINGNYLSICINSNRQELIKIIKGTTVKHIYNGDIKEIKLFLSPDINEQTKIGEFFQNLDNLISLNKSKLEKLEQMKLGLLQKMLPKEDENKPVIRFKGFVGDWKRQKLCEVSDIVRGASPRPIHDKKWFDKESDVGWLRISDVTEQNGRIKKLDQKISLKGQERTRVICESHLLLSIAATVGKPVVNYIKTGVHDGFLIFLNPKFDNEFMFLFLEMYRPSWKKAGQPGSQVNLNSDIVKNAVVSLPSMHEQTKIGEFFQNLDNLISLNKSKLEKLEQIKLGLLQKMFV